MATTQRDPDRSVSMELLEPVIDADQQAVISENSREQHVSDKDEKGVPTTTSHDSNAVGLPSQAQIHFGSSNFGGEHHASYPPTVYTPQAQPMFYPGYENHAGEWEEYPSRYLNVEGLDVAPVLYNEDPALMFQSGYGYNPQMPYGPYSPATTSLPTDGQLYSPHHFFSPPYFQQSPPAMSYLNSPTPMSQGETMLPVDPSQGAFFADTLSPNTFLFGSRPDWSRASDVASSFPSHAASPQPHGVSGSFGQSTFPLASGMASQNQKSYYGFGSNNSFGRGYSHSGVFPHVSNYGGSISSFGNNGRNSLSIEKGWRRGKGNALLYSSNSSLDFPNEQSRGPRATRPKKQTAEHDDKSDKLSARVDRDLYNRPDFATEYKDAKFFIIKSYSEDNVHKSIKYGVWASTVNGNKKLDVAYHEAKEKEQPCPIFLLFSVNASGQFCGVAEMTGPVDFEKSVDYWQQDKWTGQFPVKWHIVKDVPNNLFRHIILEYNDHKPVTNSRDTQEVKLEQGLEMLKIFKNHDDDLSILDDFDFYEENEKKMQESKGRLLQQEQVSNKAVPFSADVNKVTKSFAQVVRLGDTNNLNSSAARAASVDSSVTEKPVELINTSSTASKESTKEPLNES